MISFSQTASGVGVVSLVGEFDLSDVAAITAEVKKLDGLRGAVVDLSKTDYVDSSVLGVIVEAYKRARVTNQAIFYVRPGHGLSRVLEIVGLDKILPIRETLDEALAEAGAAPS